MTRRHTVRLLSSGRKPSLFSEGNKLKERVRTTLWQWGEDVKDYLAEGVLCKGLDLYSQDWGICVGIRIKSLRPVSGRFALGSYEVPVKALLNMTAKQLSVWGGGTQLLGEDLCSPCPGPGLRGVGWH